MRTEIAAQILSLGAQLDLTERARVALEEVRRDGTQLTAGWTGSAGDVAVRDLCRNVLALAANGYREKILVDADLRLQNARDEALAALRALVSATPPNS